MGLSGSLLLTVATLLILTTHSSGQNTCIVESTKCQCSSSTPSGMCMRFQGDGNCLLGACQAGYRCDCFGYEMCSINKCSKYVTAGNEVASETVPFRCQKLVDSAECVVVQDVLDTDDAAHNAEADASSENNDASEIEMKVSAAVEAIIGQKKVVNQMLKDIESVSDDVEEEEMDAIDADAEVVENAIEESSDLVQEVAKESKNVCEELKAVRKLKREVRKKTHEFEQRKRELKEEESKPNSAVPKCVALKKRMQELEAEKKKAARGCGLKAQKIRQCKKRAQEKLGAYQRVRERGAKSFHGCMGKVKKCLRRVGSRSVSSYY